MKNVGRMNMLSGGIKVGSAALTFLMFLFLARSLGAEEYGKFATIFSLASFLSYVVLLGQHTRLVKRVSTFVDTGEWGNAKAILFQSFSSVVMASVIVSVGLALYFEVFKGTSFEKSAEIAIATIPLILPLAISELVASAFRGVGSVGLALFPRDIAWRGAVVICSGVPYFTVVRGESAAYTAAIVSLLLVFAIAVQMAGFRRISPGELRRAMKDTAPAGFWSDSLWLWFASIVGIMTAHISVVLISGILTDISTGAFFAASKLSQLLQLPVMAANIVAAPIMARQFAKSDVCGLRSTCRSITPFLFGFSLFGALLISLLPSQLLSIFDQSYSVASSCLIILVAAQLFNALCGPTGTLMLMSGGEKSLVVFVGISEAIGLLLLMFWTPKFGLTGAAFAVLVGKVAWNVLSVYWCRKNLEVDTTVLCLLGRKK